METLLLVIIGLLVVGFGAVIYFFNQRLQTLQDNLPLNMIKQDIQNMSQQVTESQQHMSNRLDKAANVFSKLQNELGKMQELGRSIRDIQDVLKSPKQRGNIGEQLMSDLIKQQIPQQNFDLQYDFRSGDTVDAIIKTKNGLIPIDSKFPNENYLKLVQTEEEKDKEKHHKQFVNDVRKHIRTISKKYIVPQEGTVDFALMYVPGEAVYYEIMTNTELSDYGAENSVYLVSPHTFYYFLQTVLLSLEGELIEQQAREVMNYLKAIQSDADEFGEDLQLVSKHLKNAKNAADTAVNNYQKLSNKIDSVNRLTESDETGSLTEATDIKEAEKLGSGVGDGE